MRHGLGSSAMPFTGERFVGVARIMSLNCNVEPGLMFWAEALVWRTGLWRREVGWGVGAAVVLLKEEARGSGELNMSPALSAFASGLRVLGGIVVRSQLVCAMLSSDFRQRRPVDCVAKRHLAKTTDTNMCARRAAVSILNDACFFPVDSLVQYLQTHDSF